MLKRYLIPISAFLLGASLIAFVYLGILSWAQGWEYASSQFERDRWYVVPIILGFGVQAALYVILRFRLFIPVTSTGHAGALMGTSGGTSATAMVACCIHHVTDVLPILGLSAAASFLTQYQRPFMLIGLAMNLIGIGVMLVFLYRERQKYQPVPLEAG
jgi:phosphoglycerol transferase MdoB-like AlkP superfamily enzyme